MFFFLQEINSLKDVDSPRYQNFCRTPPRTEDIAHRSAVTGFSGKTKKICLRLKELG